MLRILLVLFTFSSILPAIGYLNYGIPLEVYSHYEDVSLNDLSDRGIIILKNFCDPKKDSLSIIEEKCYRFGLKFGSFLENYPKFYYVYDRGFESYNMYTRYSDTNKSHGFHTDGTVKVNNPRYVLLYCVEEALEGGVSKFVNMLKIRKILEQYYPNILAVLEQDIIRDCIVQDGLSVEESISNNAYPIFFYSHKYKNYIFRYMRRWIEVAYIRIDKNIPPYIKNALDVLDSLLNAPSNYISYKLQKGDLIIFDNYFIAHDRSSYIDTPNKKRFMLRGWIYD